MGIIRSFCDVCTYHVNDVYNDNYTTCPDCRGVICDNCLPYEFEKGTTQYCYGLDNNWCPCCKKISICEKSIREIYDKILDKVSSEDKKDVEQYLDELKKKSKSIIL